MRRFFLLFGMLAFAWNAQAQCPGCIVTIPASFPADTIHLDLPPDGQVGVAYDQDISFRMPMTTTPVSVVDPDVPPGLNIDQIEITGFTGLPPGLEWEANQSLFMTGDGETDGCVKICGTPLQPDTFFMNVLVEVSVFGLPANSSFIIPLYIEPAVIQTDGFAMENSVGCGSTTVSFSNNVPSNGLDGYSYFWDFGNGLTSTEENPGSVTYSTPGTYEVNYTATIDTAQSILTGVTIQAAGCGDIAFPPNDAPDLYLTINKPNGQLAFITPIQDNVSFPATFDLIIPLEAGNYTIEVTDDDLIGSQSCGTVTFNEDTNGLLFDGELQVTVSILNPLVTIVSSGTVNVYDFPDAPVITGADGNNSFCSGDSLLLSASYADGLQWYLDTLPIPGATGQNIYAQSAGDYWVIYTSPEGCSSTSDFFAVSVDPSPQTPVFANQNNLLSLSDPGVLPANYEISWFEDGFLIPGETGTELCIVSSGTYTLMVTDLDSGCSSSYTASEMYDGNLNCTDNTSEIAAAALRLYPNPTAGSWQVEIPDLPNGPIRMRLLDVQGRLHQDWQVEHSGGFFQLEMESLAPAGVYLLLLEHPQVILQQRLILQ